MEGIIIEVLPEKYNVEIDKNIFSAVVRGNVKRKDKLLVGDRVVVSKVEDKYVIEKVMPRKKQYNKTCNL